jgi:hypothetical protein
VNVFVTRVKGTDGSFLWVAEGPDGPVATGRIVDAETPEAAVGQVKALVKALGHARVDFIEKLKDPGTN